MSRSGSWQAPGLEKRSTNRGRLLAETRPVAAVVTTLTKSSPSWLAHGGTSHVIPGGQTASPEHRTELMFVALDKSAGCRERIT